jgi:2-polyprenyl-3-methyl-5-hydroxy-6-metoxy-1,4-benzoquinol methylase
VRALRRRLRRREEHADSTRIELEARRERVVAEHGEWTAHNIHVGAGVHTRGDTVFGDEYKVRRAAQLIEDLVRRPWSELRIADLGCNEALYACEFALRGAAVVGIEGREANIEKARFARDALGLDRLELVQADVRELSRQLHGGFDVVLCWGLLYHLDTPDVFRFVERMREVCDGAALIDTHISLADEDLERFDEGMFLATPVALGPLEARTYRGEEYWGRSFVEHSPGTTAEERLQASWASLDNPNSFWLTRPSLANLLVDSGFASVLEAHAPRLAYPPDRVTFVACGAGDQELLAAPLMHNVPDERLPERPPKLPR